MPLFLNWWEGSTKFSWAKSSQHCHRAKQSCSLSSGFAIQEAKQCCCLNSRATNFILQNAKQISTVDCQLEISKCTQSFAAIFIVVSFHWYISFFCEIPLIQYILSLQNNQVSLQIYHYACLGPLHKRRWFHGLQRDLRGKAKQVKMAKNFYWWEKIRSCRTRERNFEE